ncbi:23S rRNA (uracil(1939)-C(5))-methyltransferase RlmD [Peptoniphilus mikwangii]|uniref:23S rRNA (uracil(1939)-C(5))-methyltransferase RlmD n=1 Tax=Peptoniphilus mikwangii TaxID=1354300 RepID=UPI00041CCE56|nr:23S rRNA (uracil(1939)-C(5))-methyltransferase RlmD [Peptoniphilus mikwangii]
MAKSKIISGKVINVDFPNRCEILNGENRVSFKGAILGQEVEVKLTRRTKGKLLNILNISELENENNCPHSEVCGGCTYQTMSYECELEYKKNLITKLFKENDIEFEKLEFISSPVHKAYRNKMEYTFSDEYKDGPLSLGLHKKNRFYEVVNTDECNIVNEDFNIIRKFTLEYFMDKLKPYNRMRHTGTLRHLLIRRSSIGEVLVNLVTASSDFNFDEYFEELLKLELSGKVVGIMHTINDSFSDAIVPEKIIQHYGVDYINEELLGLKFKVSCFSFFQTNTESAKVLYTLASNMLGDLDNKILLDLYSGTGTITQILGRKAKSALGIEIVKDAVESARKNAEINNLNNVKFICDDVFKAVKELEYKADVIVLDPPREGINPKAIDKIISFRPEKFLYISCNPITFVRDLKIFLELGYEIIKLKALDQFPRTNHVETVALLERR